MNRPEGRTDAGLFDFITNQEFKACLKRDFEELQASVKGGLWKATHVLAGSIIEAILVDYLIASGYEGRSEAELLTWTLGPAIEAGKKAGVVTQKTAQMCAVVRDYRNLIHPGRIVRLKETVDEDGATVALSLVRIVARDIAKKKKEVYGYTAEQLVRKIEDDRDCIPILPHLLRDMNETEKERLLLEVLPRRNYGWYDIPLPPGEIADPSRDIRTVFQQCVRLVREQVAWSTKKKVVEQYVSILKEQTASYRKAYEEVFFVFSDLEGVGDSSETALIKEHLLGRLKEGYNPAVLTLAKGIGKAITLEDVKKKAARALWAPVMHCDDLERESFAEWFVEERRRMEIEVEKEFVTEVEQQAMVWKQMDRSDACARLMGLIIEEEIPF